MLREVVTFGAVGVAATVIHSVVGLLLIAMQWPPFVANTAGFTLAFGVSYVGHRAFTFKQNVRVAKRPFRRFACVAIFGFLANQGMLAVFTIGLSMDPAASLLVATFLCALTTFLLARNWAFRSEGYPI